MDVDVRADLLPLLLPTTGAGSPRSAAAAAVEARGCSIGSLACVRVSSQQPGLQQAAAAADLAGGIISDAVGNGHLSQQQQQLRQLPR